MKKVFQKLKPKDKGMKIGEETESLRMSMFYEWEFYRERRAKSRV